MFATIMTYAGFLIALGVIAFIAIMIPICFRVVVPTNDVHIVQSGRATVSYGKDQSKNIYYAWPSWVPVIGVSTIKLPVSVFKLELRDYAAYDKDRLPFMIDIISFFRISDSNVAAQRIESFNDLNEQLKGILQGAIRSILASSDINMILEARAEFGNRFTSEVNEQLKEWGVTSVKNIELMDIRDAEGSKVISNIMAMKKSAVEAQSRVEVAKNMNTAQTAEIENQRDVDLRAQEALQQVNVQTAQQVQATEVAKEQAKQIVAEQQKITAEKNMAVAEVNQVRAAEIAKSVEVVAAEQKKQVSIVEAEGHKQQTVLVAQGDLESTKLTAEGIQLTGNAKAEAEKAMQLAPVQAQIALAKEIGENAGYQKYLLTIREIEKDEKVGIEQAAALEKAEVKVIANTGSATSGLKSAMDLFTPAGGTNLGAAVEAFIQTPAGGKLMDSLVAHAATQTSKSTGNGLAS